MLKAFGLLAKFKFLRGSKLDPFGYFEERRMEQRLIEEYFSTVDSLLQDIDATNHDLAVEIAEVPMTIRGYGHVKDRNIVAYRDRVTAFREGEALRASGIAA